MAGVVRNGQVWSGVARHGQVRSGAVSCGQVCSAWPRVGRLVSAKPAQVVRMEPLPGWEGATERVVCRDSAQVSESPLRPPQSLA